MSKSKIYFIFIFLLYSFNLLAQNGTVSGRVVDSENSQPLEYASVVVYSIVDSLLISGTITESSGIFKIEKLPNGLFYIRVQFLGHETLQTSDFMVISEGETILGDLKIQPSAQLKNKLNITGNDADTSVNIEKQIYSAAQLKTEKSETAMDVVKKLPSISVNDHGDIVFHGTSVLLVLVNGKPAMPDSKTTLSQIPANSVSNVELITSRSIGYNADDNDGIINIITEKNR